jgi:hypothetical protein
MQKNLPTQTEINSNSEIGNLHINRDAFTSLLEGALHPIAKNNLIGLVPLEISGQIFTSSDELLSGKIILEKIEHISSRATIALAKRALLAGVILQLARENGSKIMDIRGVWPMLYSAINKDCELPLIASLGSQGFLSIPLFFKGNGSNISSILRLHFWHKSMFKDIKDSYVRSSIHSHRFHATSWVLKGSITDYSYKVTVANHETNYCFFELEWKPSKSESLDENKSIIKNSGIFADLTEESIQTCQEGQSYEIACGVFHASHVEFPENDSLISTLFLFDAHNGIIESGGVVGPSNVEQEETIRHPFTANETYQLIENLNELLR